MYLVGGRAFTVTERVSASYVQMQHGGCCQHIRWERAAVCCTRTYSCVFIQSAEKAWFTSMLHDDHVAESDVTPRASRVDCNPLYPRRHQKEGGFSHTLAYVVPTLRCAGALRIRPGD